MNIHTHTTPEVLCIGQVLMDCIIKGWNSASYKERVQTADSVTLSWSSWTRYMPRWGVP